jgi:hypothetical protein
VNYQEKNRQFVFLILNLLALLAKLIDDLPPSSIHSDIDYENFRPEGGSEPTQQRSQQQQQGPQSDIEKALQMSLQAVQPQQSQGNTGNSSSNCCVPPDLD